MPETEFGTGSMKYLPKFDIAMGLVTLKVGKTHDLYLESADPVMGSAHCLTERDIWMKLTINHSKGSEDIEWTQN